MTAATTDETADRPLLYLALGGVLLTFFLVWTWLSTGEGRVHDLDRATAQYWAEFRGGVGAGKLWGLMVRFTELGSIGAMIVLAAMGVVWQESQGRRLLTTAWVATVAGGALLNVMLKTNLDRDRPPEALRDRAVLESNQSYPSGHSMGAAIGYGFLGYVLARQVRGRARRVAVVAVLAALVAGIGFSRVYLRAHWLSDVVGGYAVGFAWLFLCIGLLEWRRRSRVRVGAAASDPPG